MHFSLDKCKADFLESVQFGTDFVSENVTGERVMPFELRIFLQNLPEPDAKRLLVWLGCNPLAVEEMILALEDNSVVSYRRKQAVQTCVGV